MFHPENLSLFLSTLGLYLAARLLVRGRFGWLPAFALGAVLGLAQLVRSQGAWTFAAVVISLVVLALAPGWTPAAVNAVWVNSSGLPYSTSCLTYHHPATAAVASTTPARVVASARRGAPGASARTTSEITTAANVHAPCERTSCARRRTPWRRSGESAARARRVAPGGTSAAPCPLPAER